MYTFMTYSIPFHGYFGAQVSPLLATIDATAFCLFLIAIEGFFALLSLLSLVHDEVVARLKNEPRGENEDDNAATALMKIATGFLTHLSLIAAMYPALLAFLFIWHGRGLGLVATVAVVVGIIAFAGMIGNLSLFIKRNSDTLAERYGFAVMGVILCTESFCRWVRKVKRNSRRSSDDGETQKVYKVRF